MNYTRVKAWHSFRVTHCKMLTVTCVLFSPCWFSQTERHSPLLGVRSRPSLDGGKMRASVRMTRYLESWGAAKPFANLHHRDSMTTDNGKINTTVSTMPCSLFHTQRCRCQLSIDQRCDCCFRMFQWGSTTSSDENGELGGCIISDCAFCKIS